MHGGLLIDVGDEDVRRARTSRRPSRGQHRLAGIRTSGVEHDDLNPGWALPALLALP